MPITSFQRQAVVTISSRAKPRHGPSPEPDQNLGLAPILTRDARGTIDPVQSLGPCQTTQEKAMGRTPPGVLGMVHREPHMGCSLRVPIPSWDPRPKDPFHQKPA